MSTSSPAEVPSITGVPTNLRDDQNRRLRSYLLQMGLRVVLIIVAALFAEGWLLWLCIAGAVILPYTAVLLVNAGRDRQVHDVPAVPPQAPPALPAQPTVPPQRAPRVVDHVDLPDTGTSPDDSRPKDA